MVVTPCMSYGYPWYLSRGAGNSCSIDNCPFRFPFSELRWISGKAGPRDLKGCPPCLLSVPLRNLVLVWRPQHWLPVGVFPIQCLAASTLVITEAQEPGSGWLRPGSHSLGTQPRHTLSQTNLCLSFRNKLTKPSARPQSLGG